MSEATEQSGQVQKRIVLGVSGGIAAYKAAEVVRLLQRSGHSVRVVMTDSARQFIQPLTFTALTGERVITSLFSTDGSGADTLSSAVEHIGVARECDLLLVAPATANVLAKFAHGLADDFLSTLYLAYAGPVVLAPAMNDMMWQHRATQHNLENLRRRNCHIVDPEEGWLACGTTGAGRLADPARIATVVDSLLRAERDFEGETLLITAGPTQEPIDPVRYLTNRSSGKMGYALADAAVQRGANVILVSGPVSIPPPSGVELIRVQTAAQMCAAVLDRLPEATVIIKAAAVADYRVSEVPDQKIKKSASEATLRLVPTEDILAAVGKRKADRILVGFAAETQNVISEAKRKLAAKNCDLVIGNLVGTASSGFELDTNEIDMVDRCGNVVHAGPAPKREIAGTILDQIRILKSKNKQQ